MPFTQDRGRRGWGGYVNSNDTNDANDAIYPRGDVGIYVLKFYWGFLASHAGGGAGDQEEDPPPTPNHRKRSSPITTTITSMHWTTRIQGPWMWWIPSSTLTTMKTVLPNPLPMPTPPTPPPDKRMEVSLNYHFQRPLCFHHLILGFPSGASPPRGGGIPEVVRINIKGIIK